MKPKFIALVALGLATISIVADLYQYFSFNERVRRVVETRERNYSQELIRKLNKTREAMGEKSVAPTNFAEVLSAYFEGMAAVLDAAVLNPTNATSDTKSTRQQ
jgi:hypothetical protein